jgi:hypothetical protein
MVGVMSGGVILAGCSGGSGSPSASNVSTTTTKASQSNAVSTLDSLYASWTSALDTESAANKTEVDATALLNADITKQNQRIQQDETTVNQNEYGLGCDAADYSTYGSCVAAADQKAAAAQSDEAAATAQVQTDDQQYATNASTFESALSAFLSQIADLNWPNSMTDTITSLVKATQTYRNDTAEQATITSASPDASAIQAQAGIDLGSFNDAVSAVNAEFVHSGASLPTT